MNPQAVADVFLSYSRADSDAIQQVQRGLRDAGLTTFLDRDQLPAGQPWMPALEAGLSHCGAVAVFVGPAGLGTWQRREIQLALDRQAEVERANQAFPVIPVLLPRVTDPPGGFLRLQTWVDLRADLADPGQLHLLLAGIRGEAPTDAAIREAICPYRGLLTFREEDAGLFFGREDEVKEFVAKVRDQSLLTLVGRSGSGKSSVIYAGLIPALRRRADGRSWAVVSFRPGTEPLHALVRAFYTPPPDFTPFEVDQKIKDQVAILRSDVEALGDRIRSFLATPEEQGTDRLLLYVDQWEELYTQALRHPILDGAQAEADIARFVDLLLHAVRTSPCTVVLTVRADFYGDLLRHDALAAAVPPGLVNLGPMSRADLARAIRQPGNAVGLAVDGPLVEAMLDAVAEDLAKLPLLEYALKETWQRRREHRLTLDAYGEAGGIDGAVAKRANEIFAGLGAVEQAAARRLFVSLVTPGEGHEDTRARVAVPDDPALGAVIHAFSGADARLLVTGEDVVLGADTPVARRLVEISHEALIREWEPLREWIEANRDTLRRRERVRDWMAAWDEQEKRDPSLLLPPGLALEVGRKLLEEHGDVLIDDVRPYVEASIAAENERRRQEEAKAEAERRQEEAKAEAERQRELVAARRLAVEQRKRTKLAISLGLFGLLLAVLAGWQWLQARDQARIAVAERDRAEHNLQIAAQAADGLVFDLAQGLRNVSGVSTDMIRQILSRADKLLSELAGGEDAPANLLRTRWAAQVEFGTTYMAQGDLGAALAANEEAYELIAKLAASDPGNAQWQRNLSVSWDRLGDVRVAQGDLTGALEAYTEGKAIREKLAASDPGNAQWQRNLSVSWDKLGDVRVVQGDRPGALEAYTEGKAIREKLAASDPGNAEWQGDLSWSWNSLGDVRVAQGDLPGALEAYTEGKTIAEKLAASDPGNTLWQRNLSASWDRLGDVRVVQGDRPGALEAYTEGKTIAEKLAASDPGNAEWQGNLSWSWNKLGDVRVAQGDLPGALEAYTEGKTIGEKLAASDPGNTQWQRNLLVSWDSLGDVRVAQGDLPGALEAYTEGKTIAEKLAASDPGNAQWQRDLSVSRERLGDVRVAQGDLPGALEAYTEGKAIREKLAASDPGNAQWQRDLSVSWNKLGDVRVAQGDRPGALEAYTEGKAIREKLAASDPGNAQWQRDLSVSWGNLGDVRGAQGDLPGALEAYTEGKTIAEKLAASDPGNAGWQRDLSASWDSLGDVRGAQGDLPGALEAYTESKAIREKLAASDPGNAEWQRDLSVSWNKLGDVRVAQGDRPGALEAYTEDKTIAEKLAASDPGNAGWQRDLSASWDSLGDVRVAQGDRPGALEAYTESKAIREKLAASDPGNAEWQRDLSVSWNKLGDVRVAQGDRPGALEAYTEDKTIAEKLAASDPGNAGWQRDLSASWDSLGDVRVAQGDRPGALEAYTESKAIREKLAASDPGNAQWQRDLIVSHWNLADLLEKMPNPQAEAGAHWSQALEIARRLTEEGRLAPTDGYFVEELERRLAAAKARSPAP